MDSGIFDAKAPLFDERGEATEQANVKLRLKPAAAGVNKAL